MTDGSSELLVFGVAFGFIIIAFVGIIVTYVDKDRPAKTVLGLVLFILLVTFGYVWYDSWDAPPCICESQ